MRRVCVVGSMHERKALMANLAEGFVALPGDIGALEELFTFLEHLVMKRFVKPEHRTMLLEATSPEEWITPAET